MEKSPNKNAEDEDFDDNEIIVSQSCIDLSEMLGNIANLQRRGSNLQSSQEFNQQLSMDNRMNSKRDSDQFEAIQEESVNSSFSVNFQNNRKPSNMKS